MSMFHRGSRGKGRLLGEGRVFCLRLFVLVFILLVSRDVAVSRSTATPYGGGSA